MPVYTYKITCPYCSHKFEWRDGKVGDKIYLHCDVARSCCIQMMKNRFFPNILLANVADGSIKQRDGLRMSVRNARRK